MSDTKESEVTDSNKNYMDSVALPNVDEEVSSRFTPIAGGSNYPVPAAIQRMTRFGMNDMETMALELGSNRNTFPATVVVVRCCEDILEKLIPHAAMNEIFILGGNGEVSYAELVNPQEAPVANTVLHGHFEISAMEGNIVRAKNRDKNKRSQVTVLLAGSDGRIRGGPVRSLIAKSTVQVIVSTRSKYAVHHMASKLCPRGNELPPFQNQAKRLADVVDQVYKDTLKELNEINTFA